MAMYAIQTNVIDFNSTYMDIVFSKRTYLNDTHAFLHIILYSFHGIFQMFIFRNKVLRYL